MPAAPASELNGRTSDRPRSGGLRLGFLQPEEPPAATETSSPTATIPSPASSLEDELLDLDSGPDYDEAPEYGSSAGTSSPGTTPGSDAKVTNPIAGDNLKHVFRNGVIIATDQAHRFLAKTQGQLDTRLYAADDQDAANIGDPLARIAGRREGLGEVSPDTADLLAAMMGLAGYATKQIQKQAIAKQIDGRAPETQTIPDLDGDLS